MHCILACIKELKMMCTFTCILTLPIQVKCQKGINVQQECIPVGCVPSAAVAVCWGGGVCPGGGVSQHALGQAPPPPCEQND